MSIPISFKVNSSLQRFYENENINKVEKYYQCTVKYVQTCLKQPPQNPAQREDGKQK